MCPLSSSRMTIFSPTTVGTVLTRRSIRRSPLLSPMAPSWGMRFSAMSILARILNRDSTIVNDVRGIGGSSWSRPSIRSRIRQVSSNGSRWISLAPERMAWSRIWLTMRMTLPLRPGGGGKSRCKISSSSSSSSSWSDSICSNSSVPGMNPSEV